MNEFCEFLIEQAPLLGRDVTAGVAPSHKYMLLDFWSLVLYSQHFVIFLFNESLEPLIRVSNLNEIAFFCDNFFVDILLIFFLLSLCGMRLGLVSVSFDPSDFLPDCVICHLLLASGHAVCHLLPASGHAVCSALKP